LITGILKATLAQRFDISVDTLSRHAANHLPPQVRAAIMTQLAPSDIDLEALRKLGRPVSVQEFQNYIKNDGSTAVVELISIQNNHSCVVGS
jgi:hypothetical protein